MPTEEGSELADLLAPYWSATRTSAALGLRREELVRRLADGDLLGITSADGTDYYFPVWQFHRLPDGSSEVKPGLLPFIRTLRTVVDEGWTVGVLLRTPAPELGDLTPEQWVAEGRPQATLERYASVLAREWGQR